MAGDRTASTPWHPSQQPPADVEIVRSVELSHAFNERDYFTDPKLKNGSFSTNHDSDQSVKTISKESEFKPVLPLSFSVDDVLLNTDLESSHAPCKEIHTRSISEEEVDNNFNFHSRVLLGKVLLRESDATEAASARQARVLDFEPIHTSRNDYPVESLSKKSHSATRRYSARHRSRNATNHNHTDNDRSPMAAEQSSSAMPKGDEAGGASIISHANRHETDVAAANNFEFGSKISQAKDRGAAKHRARPRARGAPPSPAASSTPAPAPAPAPAPSREYSTTGAEEEKSGDPFSSVTIQRGNIDQIPYVLAKDIQFVPVRAQKQPTQVIFIHPFAFDFKNRPPAADVPSKPVFDNRQWVPIPADNDYVSVLVSPFQPQTPLYPNSNSASSNRLTLLSGANHLRQVLRPFHERAFQPELQPHAFSQLAGNHRSLNIDPREHSAPNYLQHIHYVK